MCQMKGKKWPKLSGTYVGKEYRNEIVLKCKKILHKPLKGSNKFWRKSGLDEPKTFSSKPRKIQKADICNKVDFGFSRKSEKIFQNPKVQSNKITT